MELNEASGRRVLVTRPEPGASRTAKRLEAMGFLPLVLPLQETVSLPVEADVARAVAVAIPSASAIRHAPRELLERLVGLPCFAVGEATARAARAAGFTYVAAAGGDAESLARLVIGARPGGTVAYLCGRVRRPIFEKEMAAASIRVATIETYDTLPLSPPSEIAERVLGRDAVDFVLVYSANAAVRIADIMARDVLRPLFEHTTLICISARTAEIFARNGDKIVIAGEPSETALLMALEDAFTPRHNHAPFFKAPV